MPLPESPLAPCPGTPNCERVSRSFEDPPDTVFRRAQDALAELGPSELTLANGDRRVDAVFRVALVFEDDVAVAVVPHRDGEAVLHVRSASRRGQSDLGVNRRRVQRFFRTLERMLHEE